MPLSKLNEEQLKAATAEFGHNLIIASAGTGKTSTIVARMAYLLNQGVKPEKIMLLTFTNKASKEMISRLSSHFDKSIINAVRAGTFHSVAYTLLKKANENLVLKQASELKILLKSLYEKRVFSHLGELKPYAASYLYELYSLFQNKNANGDFYTWFCKNFEEQSIYAEIYEDIFKEYELEKTRFNYMDFNDLLIKLKELLKTQKHEFDEILVDEYQDTNALQSSLIEAFDSKSLFCVGDYDQSIYAFNGADINIIGGFKHRFKDARIFSLNKNYRSSKSILALANKVILNNERLYPKELVVTRNDEVKTPTLLSFEDNFMQYETIAKKILQSGVSFEDIAVIFRNNSSADGLELALREQGISSVRKGSGSFFESLEVKAFCAMLSLVVNPKDIMAFIYLITNSTKGVGAVFAKELFDALLKLGKGNLIQGFLNPDKSISLESEKKSNADLGLFADLDEFASEKRFDLQSEFHSHPVLKLAKINENCAKNLEKIYIFLKNTKEKRSSLSVIKELYANELFKELCENIATKRATNKAGQVDLLRKNENLENIVSKLEILKELSKNYSEIYTFYNFLTLGSSELSNGKGVNLLSIHASKGLEFDTVFVVDLAQNRFPNQKIMLSLDEERRLFYVAVTRAKNTLYLSYAKYDRNKKTHYKPSCFLVEAGFIKENLA